MTFPPKQLLERAKQGHYDAQAELGRAYYDGKVVSLDLDKALSWLEKAHRQGGLSNKDQFALADIYDRRDRFDRSVPLLQELAEAGEARAQILMYLAYRDGNGVRRSEEQAMEWLEMAMRSGSPEAFYIRGKKLWCQYGGGNGMSDLIIASEKGFAPAMSILACMYEQGHGGFLFKIPNHRKAAYWRERQRAAEAVQS